MVGCKRNDPLRMKLSLKSSGNNVLHFDYLENAFVYRKTVATVADPNFVGPCYQITAMHDSDVVNRWDRKWSAVVTFRIATVSYLLAQLSHRSSTTILEVPEKIFLDVHNSRAMADGLLNAVSIPPYGSTDIEFAMEILATLHLLQTVLLQS
uniref:Uncharacterized protein n=1 Tax=Ditylenchus dipsaci TaxID=166011 RepID=A0A915DF81_9BILA